MPCSAELAITFFIGFMTGGVDIVVPTCSLLSAWVNGVLTLEKKLEKSDFAVAMLALVTRHSGRKLAVAPRQPPQWQ
ncbi:hypothetical protein GCM10007880_61650 [Mesorhizobium amorphae]|uniref:hypothetical protein n=1 Tax=Mesorhizobium amorphae TaxID=71433 RepID=UPI00235BCB57|nr:hypothetical protein [Mesorhizobium amorphae]GLR45647.1 hypothetical protein GCM10007880_61650 [Mesorhizobium amorphae]